MTLPPAALNITRRAAELCILANAHVPYSSAPRTRGAGGETATAHLRGWRRDFCTLALFY